jgi:DNA-binding transcriptional ArsR family regulator
VDEPLPAEVLHALAHPLRLAALVALEAEERDPGALASALGVAEPELMEHLHVLDAAGLIAIAHDPDVVRVRAPGWGAIAARLAQLQEGSKDRKGC